jgi:oxygen-independent coproporphyrinogen-3 oxidase
MSAGIYIHIPFCRSRCSYCDFATGMYEGDLAERYVLAVVKEIAGWREVDHPDDVDTIYFGGGTPSLLTPRQIELILDAVHERFNVRFGAEVTMEMNPATFQSPAPVQSRPEHEEAAILAGEGDPGTLCDFRRLGVNRASFGAQTFDDEDLRRLGRTHSAADIYATFRSLRQAGFDNISVDLIAGLPGQTMAGWSYNLDQALLLRPEHLSLYLLDVHSGTPLADQIKRGARPEPDDDLAAEMYRLMIDRVCDAGYAHYEISNFCLPGRESLHNTKYWTGEPYYGIGCSAHSFDGARRRWSNERDATRYVALIEREQTPIVEHTELSDAEARAESVFLGLRLMRGVHLEEYRLRFGSDLSDEYGSDLDRLRDAGLIEMNGGLLRLTTRGVLLSNDVFATFV